MSDAAMIEAAQSLLVFSSSIFYFVEKIVGHRVAYIQGSHQIDVLVKWQGYSQETWEPLAGLKHHQALQAYVSSLPKKGNNTTI